MADIKKEWDRVERELSPDEAKELPKGLKIIEECMESGEPFFVLRAKDIFSAHLVWEYGQRAIKEGPDNPQFNDEVLRIWEQFKQWQSEHTDQVRFPD